MWLAADKVPCLVFAGDEWQLPPPDRTKRGIRGGAWSTKLSSAMFAPEARTLCSTNSQKGPWGRKAGISCVDYAATAKPGPGTTDPLLRTSRQASAALAEVSVLVNTLRDHCREPSRLTLYSGLRIRLTRNMDKKHDFVNGMAATVHSFDPRVSYSMADDGVLAGRVTCYPVCLGYADTVHKFQGAELDHVTFWPDRPGCPAAGYVALSSVRKDSDYLLGGCTEHDRYLLSPDRGQTPCAKPASHPFSTLQRHYLWLFLQIGLCLSSSAVEIFRAWAQHAVPRRIRKIGARNQLNNKC